MGSSFSWLFPNRGAARALAEEIAERRRAEAALREANARLEEHARARTLELAERNAELEREVQRNRSLLDRHREASELAAAMIDVAPYAIIGLDAERRVVVWSRAAEAIFGIRGVDVIGRPYPLVAETESEREEQEQLFAREFAGESLRDVRIRRRHRDGAGRWVEISYSSATLYGADGKVRGIIYIAEDITERRAAEERLRQAQRMESVGQLAGGIAHDFNNLLTVVIGNLELVEEQGEDAQARGLLIGRAIHAALRGAELTQRLLAYARQQPLQPLSVDLNQLVGSLDMMLNRTLGETVTLKSKLMAGLWACRVDPGQLENAILNLAINARDAMPQGGTIVIETANAVLDAEYAARNPDVAPGEYVRLSVSDQGIGMTPEVLARAFEPYFTTKEIGKGSGLGLSMVYGFVKQSGGHISLYSEPGHGTTVSLYLPRERRLGPQPVGRDATLSAGLSLQGRVLLVEDDPGVRQLGATLLRGFGLAVLEAQDAKAALALLGEGERGIDLLFTDVVLPGGMHGPELAKEARRRRPGLKVLYASGYTEDAILHHGRLEGGAALLSKPYRKDELARRLSEILGAG
jgi:PAS domain S-box-containing protein